LGDLHHIHSEMWMAKRKRTGKNITVYVSDETALRMDGLREVNWSQICKEAIDTYIEARKSINPQARLKFQKLKQTEKNDGYLFGSQLASEILDGLNYQEVRNLRWEELETQDGIEWWHDDRSFQYWFYGGTEDSPDGLSQDDSKKLQRKFEEWGSKKGSIAWVLRLAEKKKEFRKTPPFLEGMIAALKETLAA
jgi:hypothetical protein